MTDEELIRHLCDTLKFEREETHALQVRYNALLVSACDLCKSLEGLKRRHISSATYRRVGDLRNECEKAKAEGRQV